MILILVAGIELAGELFAIVQITSVRRVINDVSTDDLKIWIPPSTASFFVDDETRGAIIKDRKDFSVPDVSVDVEIRRQRRKRRQGRF